MHALVDVRRPYIVGGWTINVMISEFELGVCKDNYGPRLIGREWEMVRQSNFEPAGFGYMAKGIMNTTLQAAVRSCR